MGIKKSLSKQVITWFIIIIIGFVLRLLHLISAFLIVVGFAGLTAQIINDMYILKKPNKLSKPIIVFCSIFLLVLIYGNIFNNGYPLNNAATIVYTITLTIALLIHIIRNKKTQKPNNN